MIDPDQTYYAERGLEDEISVLYTRTVDGSGNYELSPAAGGWIKTVPVKEFDAHFVEIPAEDIAAMVQNYRPARMTYLDEGDEFMNGFINGERWNGWLQPLFTREDLLSAQQAGGYMASNGNLIQILEDPDSDALFLVHSTAHDGLHPSVVRELLRMGILSDSDHVCEEDFDEAGRVDFHRLRPRTIVVDDEPIEVFDTSCVGWTWMELPAPDQVPSI